MRSHPMPVALVGECSTPAAFFSEQSHFLVVLVCWLALIFGSFGLFARPNATVIVIQISSAPLREALGRLGQ